MVPTTTKMTTTTTATICVSGAIRDDGVVPEDEVPPEEDVGVASVGGIEGGVPERSGFSTCVNSE